MDVDESYTALIAQGPFNKIFSQVKETTNSPLYFYLLWAWGKIAGYSPIALRMLSVLFGMATVVATYIVTKILISGRAARWSALVMVLSPLWLFRARDARMYSVVGFLSILAFYMLYRALTRNRGLDWVMLVFVFVVSCYNQQIALFLLPVFFVPFVSTEFKAQRRRSVASLVAIVVIWLPWTPVISSQAKSGGMQWMQGFWESLPPSLAIPKSLLAFMPGTFYPIIMRPLPHDPSYWMWFAVAIYGLSFVMALRWLKTNTELTCRGVNIPKPLMIHGLLAIFLFCPLLLIWIYSLLLQPIYLVGRYDIIAIPAFCIWIGLGIDQMLTCLKTHWSRIVAGVLIILLGLLWEQTANQYYQGLTRPFFLRNSVSAQFLAQKLSPDDVLIYLGLRRAGLEYALRQRGLSPAVEISFPSELDVHFSWTSASDMMSHRENLVTQCESLMDKLYDAGEENQRVWVATAGDDDVSRLFWEIMKREFAIDQNDSRPQIGLFRLVRKPPDS